MPNGPLTPLGRQLRTVLSNLTRSSTPPSCPRLNGCRALHAAAQLGPAAINEDQTEVWVQPVLPARGKGFQYQDSRIPRSRKRHDYIGEALNVLGSPLLSAQPRPGKIDLSYTNLKRKNWRQTGVDEDEDVGKRGRVLSLPKILAHYIKHTATTEEPAHFRLSKYDAKYLRRRGYELEDVHVWASALAAPDSLDAATILERRVMEKGWKAVPFPVHQYLLRRQHIKPAALRIIMQQTQVYLNAWKTDGNSPAPGTQMLFIAFMRMLRHAREVWPQAIESLAEMLLLHLPTTASATLAQKTLMLNTAMVLMSTSSAVQPLKHANHQETAVVHVLRYMAEHDPPIMLTRPGYRAVVRVQLSQQKTADERQWAELKALSWPPWKVDRTNKDSLITPDHGISRAGHTLARMREAGYAPQAWEKAAEIYAGWDVDRTPSIQVRTAAHLDFGHSSDELIWAARIKSTRTAQEAWAAYLAYDDGKQQSSSVVHLAIFEKLFAEEHRQRCVNKPGRRADSDESRILELLLPGDSKEISPLPPSSHLYTYTRTPPPTVEDLFRKFEANGVAVSGHCLAFIVRNAASLQLGFQYLQWGQRSHPQIKSLFSYDHGEALTGLPDIIFAAIIELLCRHSAVSLSTVMSNADLLHLKSLKNATLDSKTLNRYHAVVCAMELLRVRTSTLRPAYNAVLRALCRDRTQVSVRWLIIASEQEATLTADEVQLEKNRNQFVLYRMVGRTLSLMQDASVSLDASGCHYLCLAVENVAIASWNVVKYKYDRDSTHDDSHKPKARNPAIVTEVYTLLRQSTPTSRLKHEFSTLVGQEIYAITESRATTDMSSALPRMLTTPSPGLLHAYIRALGWMGDHEAICLTVKWMATHHIELVAHVNMDRNGKRMMRRFVVALRAFLERSWMAGADVPDTQADDTGATKRTRLYLARFEEPASQSVVEEIKTLVESVDEWQGWPSDEEVERYCRDERFEQIRRLYEQ